MKTVFVIISVRGQYEDKYTTVEGVYETKELADNALKKFNKDSDKGPDEEEYEKLLDKAVNIAFGDNKESEDDGLPDPELIKKYVDTKWDLDELRIAELKRSYDGASYFYIDEVNYYGRK